MIQSFVDELDRIGPSAPHVFAVNVAFASLHL